MPTTKRQADAVIREVDKALVESLAKNNVEHTDVHLRLSVDIQTQVAYDNHEDED